MIAWLFQINGFGRKQLRACARRYHACIASLLCLLLTGCTETTKNGNVSGKASAPQVYAVKGVVKEVKPGQKTVKIAHEKIPNYMDAMTMDFEVKDANELSGLKAGDSVSFRMNVTEKDGWIDQIKKLNTAARVENAPDNFRRVRDVEPLNIGDVMPDYHFTNEMGQATSLSQYKGQAVAITFLFTRCPFPTFCPRMSSNFEEAYKKLKANSQAPTNWHLLTITFDPQFDTPTILKSYAKRYSYDPARWNYLTGELIDITAITEQFGLMFWRPDPNEVTGISHNLRTAVIDAQGRVQQVFRDNSWKVDDLVDELIKAANKK
jgi:protein SCO1/2